MLTLSSSSSSKCLLIHLNRTAAVGAHDARRSRRRCSRSRLHRARFSSALEYRSCFVSDLRFSVRSNVRTQSGKRRRRTTRSGTPRSAKSVSVGVVRDIFVEEDLTCIVWPLADDEVRLFFFCFVFAKRSLTKESSLHRTGKMHGFMVLIFTISFYQSFCC